MTVTPITHDKDVLLNALQGQLQNLEAREAELEEAHLEHIRWVKEMVYGNGK